MFRVPSVALVLALVLSPAWAASPAPQIAEARAAADAHTDYRETRKAGWRPFGGDEPLMGRHYYHPDGPDYVSGDAIDFGRPSNLMYSTVAGEKRLVALSYNVRIAPGEPVPEGFAGTRDIWHVHDMQAALGAALQDRPILGWLAQTWLRDAVAEADGRTRMAMVHLWLIDNPDGIFASRNRALAYLDLGLPPAWAEGATLGAARGLVLATEDGCDETLDGRLWIANVDRRTTRTLKSICAGLADYVREGLDAGPLTVNRRAARAWATLEQELEDRLSPRAQARIAAMTEHGGGRAAHH